MRPASSRKQHHPRSRCNSTFHSPQQRNPQHTRSAPLSVPSPSASSSTSGLPSTFAGTRTLTFDSLAITKGPGFDLLCKSGWNPGDALGPSSPCTPSSSTGLSSTAPLPIVIRARGCGVGAQPSTLPYDNDDQSYHSHGIHSSSASSSHGNGRRKKMMHTQPKKKKEKKVYHGHSHTQQSSSSRRNNQNKAKKLMRAHSKCSDSFLSNCSLSYSSSSDGSMPTQFALLQLADRDIFDPLRPRCQHNHDHVVRDLKALRKHELTCPDNPNRLSSSAGSASSGHLALLATERHHDQRSLNGLRNNLSFSSVDSLHAEPDANIDVSDISSESEASHSDDESDECSSDSDFDCESESDDFDSEDDEEDDHQDNEDHMDCPHEKH